MKRYKDITYPWGSNLLYRCSGRGLCGYSSPGNECWMIGIDISGLNLDQALRIFSRGAQSLSEQFRHNLYQLSMQPWESLKVLEKSA